jgi:predicted ATPase
MQDLAGFRAAVRERCRAAGRTQQQLARAVGLHPDVLSHKLHQRGALLTAADVAAIVTVLADWGTVGSAAEARALLALMGVPERAISAKAWTDGPLGALPRDPAPTAVLPGQAAALAPEPAARVPVPGPGAVAAPEAPATALTQDPRAAALVPEPGATPAPGPELGSASREPDSAAAASPGGGRLAPAPLPVPLTPLVGRAAEVAAVTAAVPGCRLVTLTGTGGTGKSRVALQAAAGLAGRFPDGIAFADLAPVGDPELVAVTLLRALGLTPQSAATAEDQLAAALRPARVLLIADNMEHLVEQAPLLGRLLAAAPGLHLLVTSRIGLGLYGEQQLRVPPLRLPDHDGQAASSEAVQLFVQRARAVVPGFDPQGEALAATTAICAALDGLPLAIELAAARVRLYSPQALLPQLQARLPLLTGGPRDLPQRQQTLRATLDWSDALLPADARDLFACLGVFGGPFDAGAATAVCGAADPLAMTDRLAELAEHSLVEVTAGLTPRFSLLATVREYALARLAETGHADSVRERHLRHYLALATEARPRLDGPQQREWFDRVEADFANIRDALGWVRSRGEAGRGRLEEGLRLAAAVAPVWRRRGSLAEGALHLERLLALDHRYHAAASVTRARAVLEACALACFRGDYPATIDLAREGLELCGELGDLLGQAWAQRYLGEAALARSDLTAAQPHFQIQLDLGEQIGDLWTEGSARNMLAQVSRYQGRYLDATEHLRHALRAARNSGNPEFTANMLNSLGEVARDAGQSARARDLFRQALRGHQQTGSKLGLTADLEGLAAVAAQTGDGRAALVYLGAAKALREQSGGSMIPVEQPIIDRLLDTGLAGLSPQERQDALAEGRDRPLAKIIDEALTR